MRTLLPIVLAALAALACLPSPTSTAPAQASAPVAQVQALAPCPCPEPTYLRSSSSVALPAGIDYLELDSDAGQPITVTLPATPTHLRRVEVWLGAQPGLPGGTVTIDPGTLYGTAGASLFLDEPNEGRLLLFVKPDPAPTAGGYWRVSEL